LLLRAQREKKRKSEPFFEFPLENRRKWLTFLNNEQFLKNYQGSIFFEYPSSKSMKGQKKLFLPLYRVNKKPWLVSFCKWVRYEVHTEGGFSDQICDFQISKGQFFVFPSSKPRRGKKKLFFPLYNPKSWGPPPPSLLGAARRRRKIVGVFYVKLVF